MAQRSIDIGIIISADSALTYDQPELAARTFRENDDHYFNIGGHLTDSDPVTTYFEVAEQADTDMAISNLGLAIATTEAAAESATYTADVTLGGVDDISHLWLKFTAADLTDSDDANVTIRLTFNEFGEA